MQKVSFRIILYICTEKWRLHKEATGEGEGRASARCIRGRPRRRSSIEPVTVASATRRQPAIAAPASHCPPRRHSSIARRRPRCQPPVVNRRLQCQSPIAAAIVRQGINRRLREERLRNEGGEFSRVAMAFAIIKMRRPRWQVPSSTAVRAIRTYGACHACRAQEGGRSVWGGSIAHAAGFRG